MFHNTPSGDHFNPLLLLFSHFGPVQLFGDPMHCSPSGSPIHGILQARILEWVAIFNLYIMVYGKKEYYVIFIIPSEHLWQQFANPQSLSNKSNC